MTWWGRVAVSDVHHSLATLLRPMKIAQPFRAGFKGALPHESRRDERPARSLSFILCRPFGDFFPRAAGPALKGWAIFGRTRHSTAVSLPDFSSDRKQFNINT